MLEKKVKIQIPNGLHLRPAQEFCLLAGAYESHIVFECRGREFNAKSLLGVLSACVQNGDEILLRCEGSDEAQAAEALDVFLTKYVIHK